MNAIRKIVLVSTLIALLALTALPAFAQGTRTTTLTINEEDINSVYRVTNNPRRSVSDIYVDLQPDQVIITTTITLRGHDPVDVMVTLTPSLSSGRIFWTATAATIDGEAVSDELLTQINASITYAWRNYIRQQAPAGRVTDIDITDDTIIITLASHH
jgi:hypothetical protein